MKIFITSSTDNNPYALALALRLIKSGLTPAGFIVVKPDIWQVLSRYAKFYGWWETIKRTLRRPISALDDKFLDKYVKQLNLDADYSSITSLARQFKMLVIKGKNLNGSALVSKIKQVDADLIINAGGGLFKSEIIKSVKKGIISSHMGTLPKFRGMNALCWSLFYQETIGVTVHFVIGGLDKGRILLFKEIPVGGSKTIDELRDKSVPVSIETIVEAVSNLDSLVPVPQSENEGKQYYTMHRRLKSVSEKHIPNLPAVSICHWHDDKQFAIMASGDFLPHGNKNPAILSLPKNGYAYTDKDKGYLIWKHLNHLKDQFPDFKCQLVLLLDDYTVPAHTEFRLKRGDMNIKNFSADYFDFLKRLINSGWVEVGLHGLHHMPIYLADDSQHEFDVKWTSANQAKRIFSTIKSILANTGLESIVKGFRAPGYKFSDEFIPYLIGLGMNHWYRGFKWYYQKSADFCPKVVKLGDSFIVEFKDTLHPISTSFWHQPVLFLKGWLLRLSGKQTSVLCSPLSSIDRLAGSKGVGSIFFHADIKMAKDSVWFLAVVDRMEKMMHYLHRNYAGKYWFGLPKDVASYVLNRELSKIELEDNQIKIHPYTSGRLTIEINRQLRLTGEYDFVESIESKNGHTLINLLFTDSSSQIIYIEYLQEFGSKWLDVYRAEYASLSDRGIIYEVQKKAKDVYKAVKIISKTTNLANCTMADIGCGYGVLLGKMNQKYPLAKLMGSDIYINPDLSKLYPKINFVPAWAENLPFPSFSFDVVIACSVLPYLMDDMAGLSEIVRVAKLDGWVVLYVPRYNHPGFSQYLDYRQPRFVSVLEANGLIIKRIIPVRNQIFHQAERMLSGMSKLSHSRLRRYDMAPKGSFRYMMMQIFLQVNWLDWFFSCFNSRDCIYLCRRVS